VRVAVLYTHTPVLFEIGAAVIDACKPMLQAPQQSLSLPDIE
jgi:hypothetical protein